MNAGTVDNVGTLKLKMLVMESIKEFPRGINSDQVISLTLADGCNGSVHPGPGLKPQAAGVKLSNQPVQASSDKRQAPGSKLQASSHKRQA